MITICIIYVSYQNILYISVYIFALESAPRTGSCLLPNATVMDGAASMTSPLLYSPPQKDKGSSRSTITSSLLPFLPSSLDDDGLPRSFRRKVFLVMTNSASSRLSFSFFLFIMSLVAAAVVIHVMESMRSFSTTPETCSSCKGGGTQNDEPPCVCEAVPVASLEVVSDVLYYTFTVELFLRLAMFSPAPSPGSAGSFLSFTTQFLHFFVHPWQLIDLLAILPFWFTHWGSWSGLSGVRILRLCRVFQVVKLGKYNKTLHVLLRVLRKSLPALKLLLVVLLFGTFLFGCLMYEAERGLWKYTDLTSPPSWQYVRKAEDGETEELTPFFNIPAAFWWFIVTSTTVGYGDLYPTSVLGKFISGIAILLSLLVVAFRKFSFFISLPVNPPTNSFFFLSLSVSLQSLASLAQPSASSRIFGSRSSPTTTPSTPRIRLPSEANAKANKSSAEANGKNHN